MALTGININDTIRYTSPSDPDQEHPTVFEIGVLSSDIEAEIERRTQRMGISSNNPDEQATVSYSQLERDMMYVRFGLKGMENFLDPQTGREVQFRRESMPLSGRNVQVVDKQIMAMLPRPLIQELAAVVRRENDLTEDEQKN